MKEGPTTPVAERVPDTTGLPARNRVIDCRSNDYWRTRIFDARDGAHRWRVYDRHAERFSHTRIPAQLHLDLCVGAAYAVGRSLLTRVGDGERNSSRDSGRGHVVGTPEANTPGTDRHSGNSLVASGQFSDARLVQPVRQPLFHVFEPDPVIELTRRIPVQDR